ncbi:MAG: hypothetical protein V3T31_00205 [candidate division Zixibacteria bacterium]
MKLFSSILGLTISILLLAGTAFGQIDAFGITDTLYADVARIDDNNWSITISYTNDEPVIGLTVPLKMSAGLNRIIADSGVYTGGRVEHFTFKGFRPDTGIQCVLLGMVANLGPTNLKLDPGHGRLATIFVSSIDKKKIERLIVDTATVSPSRQTLLCVAEVLENDKTDPAMGIPASNRIVPAFVVRYDQ